MDLPYEYDDSVVDRARLVVGGDSKAQRDTLVVLVDDPKDHDDEWDDHNRHPRAT
ncbi:unannotated protein [freshwater metagenome]|uniref:Unannotated protein n=1 Tax=freshwater metagenome TaxID=449393 RepID=A0A6J7QFQ4_9ZZZZ